jgi:hypothetical protein
MVDVLTSVVAANFLTEWWIWMKFCMGLMALKKYRLRATYSRSLDHSKMMEFLTCVVAATFEPITGFA